MPPFPALDPSLPGSLVQPPASQTPLTTSPTPSRPATPVSTNSAKVPLANRDCGCQAIVRETLLASHDHNSEEETRAWYRRFDIYFDRVKALEGAMTDLILRWEELGSNFHDLRESWLDLKVVAARLQRRTEEQDKLIEGLTRHIAYTREAGSSRVDEQLSLRFPLPPIHSDAARAVLGAAWLPPASP